MTYIGSMDSERLEIGGNAENIVIEWLLKSKQVNDVIPTQKDEAMQKIDVDCIVRLEDGLETLVEIKSDKNLLVSNNVLFEIQRIYYRSDPRFCTALGWSHRTKADYIIWYASKKNKIIIMDVLKYRYAFQEYAADVKTDMKIIQTLTKEDSCTTVNVLIPKKYFIEKFIAYDISDEARFKTVEDRIVPF